MSNSGKVKVWPCRVSFEGAGDILILARTTREAHQVAKDMQFDPGDLRNIKLNYTHCIDIGQPLGNAPNQDGEPVQLRLPFGDEEEA